MRALGFGNRWEINKSKRMEKKDGNYSWDRVVGLEWVNELAWLDKT